MRCGTRQRWADQPKTQSAAAFKQDGGLRYANPPSDCGIALFGITIRRRLAYSSRSSNSFAHIMFSVRETAAEQ